ncbi:MAG: ABC transporter permease [Alphaproteobacteria bacterium]|nr:MAG: ABC transporter permease [Alphaproteobacteria bacterium]
MHPSDILFWPSGNRLGLWTFAGREIGRFLKVPVQTVLAPALNTLLFCVVFFVIMQHGARQIHGVDVLTFLAPGLVMMAVAQNAFANTSSSLILSKMQTNITDVLMAPLSAADLLAGFALGGVVRGLVVGAATIVALLPLVVMPSAQPGLALAHLLLGSAFLALLGLASGIWADKFDQLAAINNFVVMPATFLSGTFFTLEQLPAEWRWLCLGNPFFYMIDGFRQGVLGHGDSDPALGLFIMLTVTLALGFLCWRMLATGYKLRG